MVVLTRQFKARRDNLLTYWEPSSDGYKIINQYLRGLPGVHLSRELFDSVHGMLDIFKTLPAETMSSLVWRGIGVEMARFIRDVPVGGVIDMMSQQFVSCTTNYSVAENFARRDGHILHITILPGQRMLRMDKYIRQNLDNPNINLTRLFDDASSNVLTVSHLTPDEIEQVDFDGEKMSDEYEHVLPPGTRFRVDAQSGRHTYVTAMHTPASIDGCTHRAGGSQSSSYRRCAGRCSDSSRCARLTSSATSNRCWQHANERFTPSSGGVCVPTTQSDGISFTDCLWKVGETVVGDDSNGRWRVSHPHMNWWSTLVTHRADARGGIFDCVLVGNPIRLGAIIFTIEDAEDGIEARISRTGHVDDDPQLRHVADAVLWAVMSKIAPAVYPNADIRLPASDITALEAHSGKVLPGVSPVLTGFTMSDQFTIMSCNLSEDPGDCQNSEDGDSISAVWDMPVCTERTVRKLLTHSPDVLCLQEVISAQEIEQLSTRHIGYGGMGSVIFVARGFKVSQVPVSIHPSGKFSAVFVHVPRLLILNARIGPGYDDPAAIIENELILNLGAIGVQAISRVICCISCNARIHPDTIKLAGVETHVRGKPVTLYDSYITDSEVDGVTNVVEGPALVRTSHVTALHPLPPIRTGFADFRDFSYVTTASDGVAQFLATDEDGIKWLVARRSMLRAVTELFANIVYAHCDVLVPNMLFYQVGKEYYTLSEWGGRDVTDGNEVAKMIEDNVGDGKFQDSLWKGIIVDIVLGNSDVFGPKFGHIQVVEDLAYRFNMRSCLQSITGQFSYENINSYFDPKAHPSMHLVLRTLMAQATLTGSIDELGAALETVQKSLNDVDGIYERIKDTFAPNSFSKIPTEFKQRLEAFREIDLKQTPFRSVLAGMAKRFGGNKRGRSTAH